MWLSGFNAVSASDESIWTGGQSAAGHVTPETATALSVVYACVRVIAEAVAQLPFSVYRELQPRGKERAPKHPLYPLLHNRPNSWQTSFEWRELMMWHMLLRGNAYSLINRIGLGVTELVPLSPDSVSVIKPHAGRPLMYRVKLENGGSADYHVGEILHLRGPSQDGFVGMTPIEVQRENISEAMLAQNYGAAFYRNGATMPGYLKTMGTFKDDESRRKFRASWQAAQTGGNRFKTPVLEAGTEYHELSIKHTDLQYLETRKHKDIDICRMFRVPPHKVGILDRATFSNIEHQALEFVTDTLMPWLVRFEQAIMRDLFMEEIDASYFAKFNVEGLLRGDSLARSKLYNEGVQDGWLTRNEVRELEDRNPLEGLDEPLEPLNMVPAGTRADEPKRDDSEARATLLSRANAERIATKEVLAMRRAYAIAIEPLSPDKFIASVQTFYSAHAEFVSKVMQVSMDVAQRYVDACVADLMSASELEISGSRPVVVALLDEWELTKAAELAALESV